MSGPDKGDKSQEPTVGNGLVAQEVQRRLATYGYNEIPEKRENPLLRIGRRFYGVVPWMLELTAILTWFLGNYADSIIIVGLLLFNAAVSVFQEGRARRATAALKQRLRIQSRVKRDGRWSVVPSRELVPGDVVRVRAGDLLPADIAIVEGNLDVDQSALTGESMTAEKSGGGIAYSGSAVKRGEATGVVHATGSRTYFGKTVELLELAKPKVHIDDDAARAADTFAAIVVASLMIAFVYALLTGFQLASLLPLAVVLMIAAVPVAMPTMFTLNMALGSSALAKRGVLVTRLGASEDAAAMDVLCADKTGTLTMNKLFVEQELPVNGFGSGDVLLYAALASNEANQDPIDQAFLAAAAEARVPLDAYSQTEFTPFDPKTRMTGAVIQRLGESFLVKKGSVSAICSSCGMAEEDVSALMKEAEGLSAKGLRVIAIAKGERANRPQLVGLAGVADRIREDARGTVDQIRGLGVSVKMLTGDSLPIARNIAQRLGLGDNVIAMPGAKDAQARMKLLTGTIEDSGGIAEIYPEDKYAIVKALQSGGHTVGMTGDGINDAPALQQAEVGVAVANATDIAKDSASAVLTAEGLGGIVAMIKTGRTIYQRIFSWMLNMITKKIQVVGYVVVMLFLTHQFIISILSMVLLLFLTDFATMSISTDNVRYSLKPDSLSVSGLFKVGMSMGVLSTVEGVALTVVAPSRLGLNGGTGQLYTFAFAYLVIAGMFNLMVVRERGRFWMSRPSNVLIVTTVAEIFAVSAIALSGFLELAPLGYAPLLGILGYVSTVSFLVNDPVKVYLMGRFDRPTV